MENTLDQAAGNLLSLAYVTDYLGKNHPQINIKTISPFSFTIGSNNNGEGIDNQFNLTDKSLFYGQLQICINPNDNPLANERIEILYRSFFNDRPYTKRITRLVEKENLINEVTVSTELFDGLEISQASTKYDFYLTFIGFKIDYN